MDDLSKPQRHISALDGIRGLAILGVIAIHVAYLRAIPDPPPHYLSIFHIAQFGWMGVDLFLVLSGFLITGILLDTKHSTNFFRSFYARRTLRIFPLYYGVLVLTLVASVILRSKGFDYLFPPYWGWGVYFAYLQNWIPVSKSGVFGPFWTLAIEEQFYLAWPLLVYLLPRRAFSILAGAMCLLVPAGRIFLLAHHVHPYFVLTNTLTRMDTLAWGALAALLVRSPAIFARVRWVLPWALAASAGGILFIDFRLGEFYTRDHYTESIGFTLMAIASASLILLAYVSDARQGRLAKWLSLPLLRSFGKYSYGMYVLQSFLILPAMEYLPHLPWFGHSVLTGVPVALMMFAVSWAVAWASFHLYENRFLQLKKHFSPTFRDPRTRSAGDATV